MSFRGARTGKEDDLVDARNEHCMHSVQRRGVDEGLSGTILLYSVLSSKYTIFYSSHNL